jgi:protein associated with RNAse G/E
VDSRGLRPEPVPSEPSSPLTVHKLDAHGLEVLRYPGRLVRSAADRIVLEAEYGRQAMNVGGLQMEPGDRFVETFYFDRWYNVFAVYAGTSRHLRGWYANIARPARLEESAIYAEDLALDLVVTPARSWVVLDQEEFDALAIPPADREHAQHALAELVDLVVSGSPPFDLVP